MSEKIVVEVGGGMRPFPRLFSDVPQWVFDPCYDRSQPSGEEAAGLIFSATPAQGLHRSQVAKLTAGLVLGRNLLCDRTFGDTTEQILTAVKNVLAPEGAFVVIDDDYCGGIDTESMLRRGKRSANYTERSGLSFCMVQPTDVPHVITHESAPSRLQVLLGVHAGFESQPVPLWERLQEVPRMMIKNEPPKNRLRLLNRLITYILS